MVSRVPMAFHLHKWSIGELGKPPGDLCFAAARGSNHEDVLWHDLPLEVIRHTLAAPAIACGCRVGERNSDTAFGRCLNR